MRKGENKEKAVIKCEYEKIPNTLFLIKGLADIINQ